MFGFQGMIFEAVVITGANIKMYVLFFKFFYLVYFFQFFIQIPAVGALHRIFAATL